MALEFARLDPPIMYKVRKDTLRTKWTMTSEAYCQNRLRSTGGEKGRMAGKLKLVMNGCTLRACDRATVRKAAQIGGMATHYAIVRSCVREGGSDLTEPCGAIYIY